MGCNRRLLITWAAAAVFVTLLHSQLTSCTTEKDGGLDDRPLKSELDDYLERKLQEFKLKLHQAFERRRLSRYRRSSGIVYALPEENVLPKEHVKIGSAKVFDFGLRRVNVTCWEPVEYLGESWLFAASLSGRLELFRLDKGIFVPFSFLETGFRTIKAKAFVYGNQLWLVCLHEPYDRPYTQKITLYVLLEKTLVAKQTIALGGQADMDVVSTSRGHYLVTCIFRMKTPTGFSYKGNVVLYAWRNTQFDEVSRRIVDGARSVTAWDMDGPLCIAVAQQRIDYGEVFAGSSVFIYNQRSEGELSFLQVFRDLDSHRVQHFAVHGIHYMIFLSKYTAVLFWYSGDQFLEWQTIHGAGSIDVEIFSMPNGEAAISIVTKDEVIFFSEMDTSFYNKTYSLRVAGAELAGATFHAIAGYYYAFLTFTPESKSQGPSIFQLAMQKFSPSSRTTSDPLLTCLNGLETTLAQRQKHTDKLAKNLGRVWTTDGNKPLAAEAIVIEGPVQVSRGLKAQKAVITAPAAMRVPQVRHTAVLKKVQDVGSGVEALDKELPHVVMRSGPQTILGNLNFEKPVTADALYMNKIANDVNINGVDLKRLRDNTLKLYGNQVITQPLIFSDLYVQNLTASSINGINISDFMMNNKDQVVRGNLKLNHVAFVSDLIVEPGSTINGINPQYIVTTDTPQKINGQKVFQNIDVVNEVKVETTTNGRDLSEFVKTVVPLGGDKVITGEWKFVSPLTVKENLHLNNPINGKYSIPLLIKEAVNVFSNQEISGFKTYKAPVHVQKDAEVVGKVNRIDLDKELVTLSGPQTIYGTWTCEDFVQFEKNLQTGTINGIKLHEEAVQKSKPQVIQGAKVFTSVVTVTKDITMTPDSSIDDVKPSHLVKGTDVEVVYEAPVTIEEVVFEGTVEAQKGINKYMLSDLKNLIWLKSVDQVIKTPVEFYEVHVGGDLDCRLVNGIDIDKDIVKTFGDEVIEGPTTFQDTVYSQGPVILSDGVKINGIDLNEASQLVAKATTQGVISGDITIPKLVVEKDLICETVNGFSLPHQFMLVDKEQTIKGHVVFKQPLTVKKLNVDTVNSAKLNGVDLKAFVNDIVLRNAPVKKPIANKNFLGGIKVRYVASFGEIDGVNINEMLHNVVTLNTDQDIPVEKAFVNLVKFDKLNVDYLNGFKVNDHFTRVITRLTEQTITGKKTIRGKVLVNGNVDVKGFINGMKMEDMYINAVSKTKENIFTAPVTFLNDITVDTLEIESPALLDGVPLSEAVLLSEPGTFLGKATFTNIMSDGDIKVNGLVNNCNITKLLEEAVYLSGNKQTIRGEKQFTKLNVQGNILTGHINDISVEQLASRLVMKSVAQTISGPLTFVDKVTAHKLTVWGPISNVNLTHILEDAVTKSKEQVIYGSKTFTNNYGIEVTNLLKVTGDVNTEGPVGGINTKDFMTIVMKHGHQEIHGKKVFMDVNVNGNLTLAGRLNSLRVPEDLLQSRLPEHIPGKTTLAGPAAITGDLYVDRVNDVNMKKLLHDRVTLNGNERIKSKLVFDQSVPVAGDFYFDKLNNIPKEDIVTQSGNHNLYGVKTFTKDVDVLGNVQAKYVNGIDFTDMIDRVVRTDRPEEIPDTTVFEGPVTVLNNLTVVGTMNGMDIEDLKKEFALSSQLWRGEISGLIHAAEVQGKQLKQQYELYQNQASLFGYFEPHQEIHLASKRIFTSPRIHTHSLYSVVPTDMAVVWTSWPVHCKHGAEDCCEEYSSHIMSVQPDGSFTKGHILPHRRYFPLIFRSRNYDDGFLVWTNSTSNRKGCEYPGHEEFVIASVHGEGISADLQTETRINFQSVDSPFVTDIKLFEADGQTYIVVAYAFNKLALRHKEGSDGHTEVFHYSKQDNRWRKHQVINTAKAVAIDVARVPYENKIFLSVANRKKVGPFPVQSAIYLWDSAAKQFKLAVKIPTSVPSSTLFVEADSTLFCVFANEKTGLHDEYSWVDRYTELVDVYKYEHGTFELSQRIPVYGVNCMERFKLAGDNFLVLGSKHLKSVFILQWKGFSGFQTVQTISLSPVTLHVYWSRDENMLLAVGTECGETRILKAVRYGQCTSPLDGSPKDFRISNLVSRIA